MDPHVIHFDLLEIHKYWKAYAESEGYFLDNFFDFYLQLSDKKMDECIEFINAISEDQRPLGR